MYPKAAAEAPKYERRVVLFVDFLGFKNVVARTISDPSYLAKTIKAMAVLREMADNGVPDGSKKFHQFSDCVVVSYRCDEPSAVWELVTDTGFALIELSQLGFLVRGAITVGDLLHTDNFVVGPALVEAHEIESKAAVYPRIVLSEEVIEVAAKAPAPHHDADEEVSYVQRLLAKDGDGQNYIDYISRRSVVAQTGESSDYEDYLIGLEDMVAQNVEAKAADVRFKYGWLNQRCSEAREELERQHGP